MRKGCLTITTTSPPTQNYPARWKLTQNLNNDTITGKTLPVHTDHEILQVSHLKLQIGFAAMT